MIALLLVAAQLEVHVEFTHRYFSDDGRGGTRRRSERRYFANGVLRLESGDGILLYDTVKAQVTVASKATKTYARLTLAEFDAIQSIEELPAAELRLIKLTPADHDNRCEMSGPLSGLPLRIRRQTFPSNDTAKAMQAALNRLQLTEGHDTYYILASKYRSFAPEAAACFDGPNLASKIETFAGNGFSNSKHRMEIIKLVEHPSLPAELFKIPAGWTEARVEARTLFNALLKSHGR